MNTQKKESLENKSTFDLAFGLAMGSYDGQDKLDVLNIIKEREVTNSGGKVTATAALAATKKKVLSFKSGSKAEKIYNALKEGKTPKQVFDIMNKKKANSVYYPEIYRIHNQMKD